MDADTKQEFEKIARKQDEKVNLLIDMLSQAGAHAKRS